MYLWGGGLDRVAYASHTLCLLLSPHVLVERSRGILLSRQHHTNVAARTFESALAQCGLVLRSEVVHLLEYIFPFML